MNIRSRFDDKMEKKLVDQNERLTCWFGEMDGHQWAEIAFGVFVWEIIAGKTLTWIVLNGANILNISRVLAFTRYPNGV